MYKFHCELNPIECNWRHAKREARKFVNGRIDRLREVVPKTLDSVSTNLMYKFFETCRDYERVYTEGHSATYVDTRML